MGIAPATTIMGIARGTVTIKAIGGGTVTIAVGSNDDCNSSHCSGHGSGQIGANCVVCLAGLAARRSKRERGVAQWELYSFFCGHPAAAGQRLFLRVCKTDTRSLISAAKKFA